MGPVSPVEGAETDVEGGDCGNRDEAERYRTGRIGDPAVSDPQSQPRSEEADECNGTGSAATGKPKETRYDKFFNLQVESNRVLFIVDFSGSMVETITLQT